MTITSEETERRFAERVKKLERRATLSMLVAGVAVAASAVAVAAAGLAFARSAVQVTIPQRLEVSEILLRDDKTSVRGRWTAQGLSLVDESGRLRASLSLGPEGSPGLVLFGKEGRVRTVLGLGAGDTPGVTLHDDRSQVRARIVVGSDNQPVFVLSNDKGDVVAHLPPLPVKGQRKGR